MLDGSSLRALVVGGGAVATRKTRALLAAGSTVRLVALEIDPALQQAEGPALNIARRTYVESDIGDALLVIAATSSREVNARVCRDARSHGRLVNVADAPADGNCISPATHRAGDVVIAVSAGGVPSVAARIRDCIARRYADPYAEAVAQLGALRSRLLGAGDRDGWRRVADAVIDQDFCETVERGELETRMAAWR
jgi:siroheme synthase-like protein